MKLPFAVENTLTLVRLGLFVLAKQGKPNWAIGERSIAWVRNLGLTPKTFIDIGAHESEVATWFKRAWPDIRVISFEPDSACKPIGEVHRRALNDSNARFDQLSLAFEQPCIVKVDAEDDTASAIIGFGDVLQQVDVLIAEMWNFKDCDQPTKIWQAALEGGFTKSRVVDAMLTTKGIHHYDIAFARRKVR